MRNNSRYTMYEKFAENWTVVKTRLQTQIIFLPSSFIILTPVAYLVFFVGGGWQEF